MVGLMLNFDKHYFQVLWSAGVANEPEFPGGPS